jgi:hypothetical protein
VETNETARSTFGLVGVVAGVIALGLALVHFWAGPFNPKPPVEDVVAEKAVKLRDSVVARLKGEQKPVSVQTQTFDTDRVVTISTIGAGFLAVVLAVASYIRREEKRVSVSAVALGGGAIALQYFAFAIGAIILAILVAAVLSKLDFGID